MVTLLSWLKMAVLRTTIWTRSNSTKLSSKGSNNSKIQCRLPCFVNHQKLSLYFLSLKKFFHTSLSKHQIMQSYQTCFYVAWRKKTKNLITFMIGTRNMKYSSNRSASKSFWIWTKFRTRTWTLTIRNRQWTRSAKWKGINFTWMLTIKYSKKQKMWMRSRMTMKSCNNVKTARLLTIMISAVLLPWIRKSILNSLFVKLMPWCKFKNNELLLLFEQ